MITLLGDSGPNLDGLKNVYYNPTTYKVLPFKHNYTADGHYELTGYFIPAYISMNKDGYVGDRGEYLIEKQKEYYLDIRASKQSNPKAYLDHIAEQCFTAEEAFAAEGDNKFNKMLITEQLTKIRALKQCPPIDKGYFTFQYKSGKPHKVEGLNISEVIWHSDKNIPKVRILEHPVWTQIYQDKEKQRIEKLQEEGELIEPFVLEKQQYARYVIGIDGIDIGAAQTSETTKDPSDFCAVVFKRIHGMQEPCVVAIYKDRPQDIRECYQIAIALSIYYNALINIEATRMSMVTWAKSNKFLNWFMKRPKATYPDINKIKSTQYGSPATAMVIEHHTDLTRDFVEDYCHTIWFEDMLDELSSYSDEKKRKFDIVAALGHALLADEELQGITPKSIQQDDNEFEDIGYYIDENGYKRFGVIPNKNKNKLQYNPNYYDDDTGTIRTSNPRIYYQGDW